jgi:predicted permease
MLNDLIFCLNATVPVFIMMLIGVFLGKTGIMSQDFTAKLNSFVFRVSLPLLLFGDMAHVDYRSVWDTRYVVFCFTATAASIALVICLSYLLRDRDLQGEFIQTAYRSSAALLGAALVTNIYGNIGMTPLMIIGAVPLYNIAAVVILSFYRRGRPKMDSTVMKTTLMNIAKNPLIIAIVAGLLWSILELPLPEIADSVVSSIGSTATPLGLIALGASFDLRKALSSARPAVASTFMKLIGLGCIFLPIAVHMGFTGRKLVALMIMCGSPSTVSCYVMAREMGHDGTLTASSVMLSTLLCSFTLTLWLFIFRTRGLI